MPNNVTIHVATEGLISSQELTIATDGFIGVDGSFASECFIVPNAGSIGAMIVDPRQEWFTRRDKNDALFGPLTFQQADAVARELSDPSTTESITVDPLTVATEGVIVSLDELTLATEGLIIAAKPSNASLAQVVTFLGASGRGGDPIKTPPVLFVVYMYIMGKRTLGGRTAEFHSDRELPPTT